MTWAVIEGPEGNRETVHAPKGRDPLSGYPEGWKLIATTIVEPGEDEVWSDEQLCWVPDPLALADKRAGSAHIIEAHAQKRVEAALILSGFPLSSGLLVAEAGTRGIEPEALARMVQEKAEPFLATEVARMEAKAKARAV